MNEFAAQRVAILGGGRSGEAVAEALRTLGIEGTLFDQSSGPALPSFPVHGRWDGPLPLEKFDLCVVNPALPPHHPWLLQSAEAGLPILSEPEFAARIARGPILAVTGTNGKTTTAAMAYEALRGAGLDPVLCGNIHGSGYDEIPLTLAALQARPDQPLVAEISSFQLEWVERFHPRAAGITNLGSDHLERYADLAAYHATKLRLLARQTERDVAVLPDTLLLPSPPASLVWSFGPEGSGARLGASAMEVHGQRIPYERLPFRGTHQIQNAAAALLLASGLLWATRTAEPAATLPGLLEGLLRFRMVRHRMEPLGEIDGVALTNNSMCTNAEALRASLASIETSHIHALVGGVAEGDYTPLAPLFSPETVSFYFYGRDGARLREILRPSAPLFDTMQEAADAALLQAHPGDSLTLCPGCKSKDQFQSFVHRGEAFRAWALGRGVK